jgi:hypothetical protein
MKKLFLTLAATLLMTTLAPAGLSQGFNSQDAIGTWTYFITVAGAPPCQCIQLARLRADGTADGPANDRFSGAMLGEWKKTGFREVTFTFLQNNINADGSAGGLSVIKGTMNISAEGDKATGTSKFQLLDANGKSMFDGTATFTATKLVAGH